MQMKGMIWAFCIPYLHLPFSQIEALDLAFAEYIEDKSCASTQAGCRLRMGFVLFTQDNRVAPSGSADQVPKCISCPFLAFTAFAQFGRTLNLTEDFSTTTR